MVKRSRDQSQEAPRRLSWWMIVPPDSAFHSQTFSTNFSRPICATVRLLPLRQLALDDHLRGDAGMVRARLPEHVLAAHALEADEDVLERVVQRVADVQRAGDVGRRDDDRERLRPGLGAGAGAEGIRLFPGLAIRGSTAAASKVLSSIHRHHVRKSAALRKSEGSGGVNRPVTASTRRAPGAFRCSSVTSGGAHRAAGHQMTRKSSAPISGALELGEGERFRPPLPSAS